MLYNLYNLYKVGFMEKQACPKCGSESIINVVVALTASVLGIGNVASAVSESVLIFAETP